MKAITDEGLRTDVRTRVNISQQSAIKQTNTDMGMNEEPQMKINEGGVLVWGGWRGGKERKAREGLRRREDE